MAQEKIRTLNGRFRTLVLPAHKRISLGIIPSHALAWL